MNSILKNGKIRVKTRQNLESEKTRLKILFKNSSSGEWTPLRELRWFNIRCQTKLTNRYVFFWGGGGVGKSALASTVYIGPAPHEKTEFPVKILVIILLLSKYVVRQ
jgi:hypothetical protein